MFPSVFIQYESFQCSNKIASNFLLLAACVLLFSYAQVSVCQASIMSVHCFTNISSNFLLLAACFSFSMATSPTCLTRSLDKPNLVKRSRLLASKHREHISLHMHVCEFPCQIHVLCHHHYRTCLMNKWFMLSKYEEESTSTPSPSLQELIVKGYIPTHDQM